MEDVKEGIVPHLLTLMLVLVNAHQEGFVVDLVKKNECINAHLFDGCVTKGCDLLNHF